MDDEVIVTSSEKPPYGISPQSKSPQTDIGSTEVGRIIASVLAVMPDSTLDDSIPPSSRYITTHGKDLVASDMGEAPMRVKLVLNTYLIVQFLITEIQLLPTTSGQVITPSQYRALVADTAVSSAIPFLEDGGLAVLASKSTYRLAFDENTNTANEQQPTSEKLQVTASFNQPIPESAFIIGGTALAPGSAITISGTTYSLPTNGPGLLINGSLQALPVVPTKPIPTAGAARLIATPSRPTILVIEGQTLLAGSDITVSGTAYSLPTSGSKLFVNGQPTSLPSTHPYEVFTIGSIAMIQTRLPDSGSIVALLINHQTLFPGSNLIFSRTTYSLPTSGSELFVNGEPTPLPSVVRDQRLVLGSLTATQASLASGVFESGLLIEGQPLRLGSAIVVSGTTYSLPSSAGLKLYMNGRATVLPSNMLGYFARGGSTTAFETSPALEGSGNRGGPSGQAADTDGSVNESDVVSGSA